MKLIGKRQVEQTKGEAQKLSFGVKLTDDELEMIAGGNEEKPYKCSVCGREFKSPTSLSCHKTSWNH